MRKLIIYILLLPSFYLYQQVSTDSILKKLQFLDKKKEISISDTSVINALNDVTRYFLRKGDYDTGLVYAHKAVDLSEKILTLKQGKNDFFIKKNYAVAVRNIALYYHNTGNYPKALETYFKSLRIREEIRDMHGIAESYNTIGALYNSMNDPKKSLEFHLKSLAIRKEIDKENPNDKINKRGLGSSYNNIGINYNNQAKYQEALEQFQLSIKMKQEGGDEAGIANTYVNIGSCYISLSKYDEAVNYFMRAIDILFQV